MVDSVLLILYDLDYVFLIAHEYFEYILHNIHLFAHSG